MPGFTFHLIYLLPLIGFVVNGLWGNKMSRNLSGAIGSVLVFIPFLITSYLFYALIQGANPIDIQLFPWIQTDRFEIDFGFLFDRLSLLWLLVVTGIGSLIHLYSISYMHEDPHFSRFFAYLNLFIFFMIILVIGNNLLVTFVGWEGVGLCSYLLIGFWHKKHDYNNAAKKAFIMNRIGDLGFLMGMFMLMFYFGTLHYGQLSQVVSNTPDTHGILVAATLFLFLGACGKSAQIPLYTWLPDAMAGPTPVSALIHAATMVTAGIYLIVRTNFLFSLTPETMSLIAGIGVATALVAAIIGMLQNDIKKVLAYSTVSQLGLMFMALGLGAYSSAVFHVITHAFFKACLFLGSGSVIHALQGEQNIRQMGGLRKWMPVTFITFLISTLAISGIPPFSGFFSKDEILAQAFLNNKILWGFASLASALTAFYMFRLTFLTFFTSFRGTDHQAKHLHESPLLMTIPLIVLSVLATLGGLLGLPSVFSHFHALNHYLIPILGSPHAHLLSHSQEWLLMGIAVTIASVSIYMAFSFFIQSGKIPQEEQDRRGISAVISNTFYVDELYGLLLVKPVKFLSAMFDEIIDRLVIHGVVTGIPKITMSIGRQLRFIQNGNISFYLVIMVLAFSLLLLNIFYLQA